MNDWELIQRFVEKDSQEAFASLVRRYTNMVYCTCLRELQDASLAEEAAQVVFLILSRKAHSFRSQTTLSSWLFQTALFTAKNVRRQEQRRQVREQKVALQRAHTLPKSPSGWEEAEPLLNAALTSLSEIEQGLIIQRFWEDHSLAQIGAARGITEDAARMRVNRALEKLRRYFASRNIIIPVSALAALLTQALHPAPAQCAEAILRLNLTPAPISAAGTSACLLAQGVLSAMNVKRLKLQLGAAALVVALSFGTADAVRMNSQVKVHTLAIQKQEDQTRALAVLDQMYATYTAMHSFRCVVTSREDPLATAQNATYEIERPNKIRFHRVTLLGGDMSGQALAVSDGNNLYVTCTENKGMADRYSKQALIVPSSQPADFRYWFADFGNIPSWGTEPDAGMPNVALGLHLHTTPYSQMLAPEYSLGQPIILDFSGIAQPVTVDVVIARIHYRDGVAGRDWKGAMEVVTYYIGHSDHLLYKLTAADMLSPTEWDTRTETINGMEINAKPNPADFIFTPPPGSQEVHSTSDLFLGGRM